MVVAKRVDDWSARDATVQAVAMAWIVALAAAISRSRLVLRLGGGKVSTSPFVAGSPASVVKLGGAGSGLLDLSGTLVDLLRGAKADLMAVMQTSTRRTQGIVVVTHVAIPYPWQR